MQVLVWVPFTQALQSPQVHVQAVEVEVFSAEQLTLAPPFKPLQVHVQGPVPKSGVAVPWAHKLVVGAELKDCPLAEPHWALIEIFL